jgi:hypothetical protein
LKTYQLCRLLVTLLLTLALSTPVAAANPGPIPLPTSPPIRPARPDLAFVSAGCTLASNGGRVIIFTVMNDTLIGFGFASGNFNIGVDAQLIPVGWPNSLAPQATRSYSFHVAAPGFHWIQLDPDLRVDESNEGNNLRRVQCP